MNDAVNKQIVPANDLNGYETARQIHRVLVMHFTEGLKQSDIAEKLDLSTAKVNRLIKQGRNMGMVEINIKSPVQPMIDIENRLRSISNLKEIVVTPTVSDNPEVVLNAVGESAARLLLENLKDGDTICISGGKGVSAVVDALNPSRTYDIEVVPVTGCVQGKHYTDVNHVATQMAEKLGGRAYQIHAPLFAETKEQKEMLMEIRSVKEIFERARKANIAVVGVGSILTTDSSYYDLHPLAKEDQDAIRKSGACGELLAHLLDVDGALCRYELNSRLVALNPNDLNAIPLTVGVASGANKVEPLCAITRGKYLNALVLDEETANGVLEIL